MSRRPIRCHDYVNQPYDKVIRVVREDPSALFRSATDAATSRARSAATGLQVEVGGVVIGTDIDIAIGEVEELRHDRPLQRVTKLKLRWHAAKRPTWFPTMDATLSFYPLSAEETQVDLEGEYEPPLGALGAGADALVGHRIADAAIHRFVREIAERLSALNAS